MKSVVIRVLKENRWYTKLLWRCEYNPIQGIVQESGDSGSWAKASSMSRGEKRHQFQEPSGKWSCRTGLLERYGNLQWKVIAHVEAVWWGESQRNKSCDFTFHLSPIRLSESESCSVVSDSLWPHGLYSSLNSPGRDTGVGSLSLLQGIFLTQGLNPGLPHCGQIL